jgi:hypothetical protein
MAVKQAVLLIHGIGEQRPMDTLRGFVRSVWTNDESVHHAHAHPRVFSKPDDISGSYELRRLTTTTDRRDVRTDFYEFYWAHLMEGTSLRHVTAWARRLLLRWPGNVPKQLIGAWSLIVVVLIAVGFLALQTVLPDAYRVVTIPKWVSGVLGVLVAWVAVPVLNGIVGDAARYLDPAPANVERRQSIRAKGVEILKNLHDSQEYERIILVGHSLGTVIGYDILTYAWPAFAGATEGTKRHPGLDQLENDVASRSLDAGAYQARQRELLRELQKDGCRWLVTDFVTLGSPLTHAEILLAHDKNDLVSKEAERELPTCPPTLEDGRFSFPKNRAKRTLHHAAVFGPTRWTNLYFPCRFVLLGDLIGGPLTEVFGQGIVDHSVTTTLRGGWLSHTLYWSTSDGEPNPEHVKALRKAVNLPDE